MSSMFIRRVWRFGLTGMLTTGLHVLVAGSMVNLMDASLVLANGVAFILATTFSYFMNTLWSFSAALHGKNLIRYLVVAGIGFCIAIGISWIAEQLALSYLVGIGLVVCVVPPMNLLMHHYWTYRRAA